MIHYQKEKKKIYIFIIPDIITPAIFEASHCNGEQTNSVQYVQAKIIVFIWKWMALDAFCERLLYSSFLPGILCCFLRWQEKKKKKKVTFDSNFFYHQLEILKIHVLTFLFIFFLFFSCEQRQKTVHQILLIHFVTQSEPRVLHSYQRNRQHLTQHTKALNDFV